MQHPFHHPNFVLNILVLENSDIKNNASKKEVASTIRASYNDKQREENLIEKSNDGVAPNKSIYEIAAEAVKNEPALTSMFDFSSWET